MRECLVASYPDVVAVRVGTPANDGRGGRTLNWSTVATYSGRLIRGAAAREKAEGAIPVSETQWRVLLPHDAEVAPSNRLRINGTDYDVLGIDSGREEALELMVWVRKTE